MSRRGGRLGSLLALPVVTLTVAACSQIGALTPVGGDNITTVRNAVYQVLVEQQVELLVAPKCTVASAGFTCSGTTVDGALIEAAATGTTPFPLTITIAGATVFEGNAVEVLQRGVEEAP